MKTMRMKSTLFLTLCLLVSLTALAQPPAPFITTWQTDNPGTSSDHYIIIRTTGTGYNYTVYWEEVGNESNNNAGEEIIFNDDNNPHYIDFGAPGTYRVEISGDFPRIYFNNQGDKDKILTVEQWGDIAWQSMEGAFRGCSNLTLTTTDIPNLENVTSMSEMFHDATSFTGGDLSGWDVSNVTNMIRMFAGATSFNGDLSAWDVSSVTEMSEMFDEATSFNSDISTWDVSSVTGMYRMFYGASSFNQDLGDWDISSVASLDLTFNNSGMTTQNYDATLIGWAAQTPPSDLYVSASGLTYCHASAARATLIDNYGWFISGDTQECLPFITTWETTDNQITIPTTGGGYNYDISWTNLTNSGTGEGSASGQTGDYTITGLENGSIYQVAISGDFPRIYFNNQGDKDKVLTVEQWGTGTWVSMERAFFGCSNLTLTATDVPNLSQVTDMRFMFDGATALNADLGGWDISNVMDMQWILTSSGLSTQNYDATLIGWSTLDAGETKIPTNITLHANDLRYSCEGTPARTALTENPYNWTISGDQFVKCGQTITFEALPDKTYGNEPFELTSTGGASGNDVTYFSSDETIATISGSTVTIVGAGTTTITASQAGDANYTAAPSVAQILVVNKVPLTITADAQGKTYRTADPELTWKITSGTLLDGDAMIGELSREAGEEVGTYAIKQGNLDAGSNYEITFVPADLTINTAPLTITADEQGKTYGAADPEFTWAITSGALAGEDAMTGELSREAGEEVGTYAIKQGNLDAGTNYEITFESADFIITKADQTITIESIVDKLITDPDFDVVASTTSELSLDYEVNGPATLSGTTISLTGETGIVTVTVIQAGNSNYNPATATESFNVTDPAKADQTITFGALDDKTYGDEPFDLTATASSELAVSYSSSDESVATISGTTVTIVGAGITTITASQDGDETYHPAESVQQVLTVNKATAQITITDLEQEVDGTAKEPTITTDPADLNYAVTYDGSEIAPTAADSYEVVVTITEIDYEGTATATFVLTDEEVLGLFSEQDEGLALYPNPALESFQVKSARNEKIRVFDLSGRLQLEGRTNSKVDVSRLKSGVYLVELQDGNQFRLTKR